jgi:hypothetical protein
LRLQAKYPGMVASPSGPKAAFLAGMARATSGVSTPDHGKSSARPSGFQTARGTTPLFPGPEIIGVVCSIRRMAMAISFHSMNSTGSVSRWPGPCWRRSAHGR